ncbi:hypothetical protein RHD99_07400 [Buttiauxella selenatireducens]|uniref:Uncharacterized protein n=1 Tax=Buttiauxella selenatireducens TaxID=3073902 RepID=A0ABY9SEY4_9ENTR|nr:hypothetical protein [Buttiauxella sp. R73]WMY75755.1 hypothetical protein RHD99_07400 [Buttiauxella sp. R73]
MSSRLLNSLFDSQALIRPEGKQSRLETQHHCCVLGFQQTWTLLVAIL